MKFDLPICLCVGVLALLPTDSLTATPRHEGSADSPTSVTSKASTSKSLSKNAIDLLRQVQTAQQAISAKETQKAARDIDLALTEQSRLATLTKAKGQSMIVPLYSELDDTSTLGPAIAARKGKQQPDMSKPITVDDASVQYTFVGLDLEKAKSRLEAAKMALHNNNPQAATDSLGAIGSDLTVESSENDVPLLAVRENLGLAETAVKHSKYGEASAALKQASTELNDYAGKPSAHAQEAKNLRGKIDDLSKTISEHHSTAVSVIEGWWQEVDGWFTAHT